MSGNYLNILDALAMVLTFGGILLETVADDQRYMASISGGLSSDSTFQKGLWGVSRHPNYLGEIAFWWGIFLFGMASSPDYWWTFSGALGITLLILLASIPMMENRQLARKKDYADYCKRVPMLFPFRS
jgi:steroid 5-alpha reductase family enzyme